MLLNKLLNLCIYNPCNTPQPIYSRYDIEICTACSDCFVFVLFSHVYLKPVSISDRTDYSPKNDSQLDHHCDVLDSIYYFTMLQPSPLYTHIFNFSLQVGLFFIGKSWYTYDILLFHWSTFHFLYMDRQTVFRIMLKTQLKKYGKTLWISI